MEKFIFCVDFDGTCTTHEYPNIGNDIGSVEVLKQLIDNGHLLILFTMRSGIALNDAVNWFKKNKIPLYGIQTNPTQKNWTNSPKAYCDYYIDDAAMGCPLIYDEKISDRKFVDWKKMRQLLIEIGAL